MHGGSEPESEKKYELLAVSLHEVLGIVVLNVPVTVTQVPAGPAEGNRATLVILKPGIAARAGVGTTTEYMEMNRANVNNTNRKVELTRREGNLRHVTIVPRSVPI